MRLLITGICGFVGNSLAHELLAAVPDLSILGIDNLSRKGSEENVGRLRAAGVHLHIGDILNTVLLNSLPPCDWILDCAANPSVLAGVDGASSSRVVVEQNLYSTVNLLELCKKWGAGFTLLSTSRVYSIPPLVNLPLLATPTRFTLDCAAPLPAGISERGVAETFSTAAPVSLYGSTKLCSEALALEYGDAFGFPVWINRCGVLAGAGQFSKADQGIFFLLDSFLESWTSVAIHWFRRARAAGSRLLASARSRPGSCAAICNGCATPARTLARSARSTHRKFCRGHSGINVSARALALVRRPFPGYCIYPARSAKSHPPKLVQAPSRARMILHGWFSIQPAHKNFGAGNPSHPSRTSSKKSLSTQSLAPTGSNLLPTNSRPAEMISPSKPFSSKS
jgi:nucleoside-diphosphate-sugar epimerase